MSPLYKKFIPLKTFLIVAYVSLILLFPSIGRAQEQYQSLKDTLEESSKLVCGILYQSRDDNAEDDIISQIILPEKEILQGISEHKMSSDGNNLILSIDRQDENNLSVSFKGQSLEGVTSTLPFKLLLNKISQRSVFIDYKRQSFFCGVTPYNISSSWGSLPQFISKQSMPINGNSALVLVHHVPRYDPHQYTKNRAEMIAGQFLNQGKEIIGLVSANKDNPFFLDIDRATYWHFNEDDGNFKVEFLTSEPLLEVVITGGYFEECFMAALQSILESASKNLSIKQVKIKAPLEAIYAHIKDPKEDISIDEQYSGLSYYHDQQPEEFKKIFESFMEEIKHRSTWSWSGQKFSLDNYVFSSDKNLGVFIEFKFSRKIENK